MSAGSDFNRKFAVEKRWTHHPLATEIEGSELKADYRKRFEGKRGGTLDIQAEVQFGNMARFYADVFKFQTAYSQKAIQIGVSVVPMGSLARRIDSNVANYERVIRELPSAELSITLPIVVVGLSVDEGTQIVDVNKCVFADYPRIKGRGNSANLRRIVHGHLLRIPMHKIGPNSDPGPELEVGSDDGSAT